MVPDAYSATNPYNNIEISLVDFTIENIDAIQNAIIIKTLVTNNGNTIFEQYYSRIYLVDDLGRTYLPSQETPTLLTLASCPLFQFQLDVAPGIPEQVMVCYEIPKDSKNLRLFFQDWQHPDNYGMGCDYITPCHTYRLDVETVPTPEPTPPTPEPTPPTPEPTPPTPEPTPPTPELSTGCGEGTVLVDGMCQLAETSVAEDDMESNGGYIALGLFILFGIPIIIIIVVVILIRRRKNAPKLPSADYGDVKILKRKIKDGSKIKKNQESKEVKPKKEDKKEETSMFCDNCGAAFKKPTAKFCGGCGTPRS
jgi:Sec-independent protein translocase protein TatA